MQAHANLHDLFVHVLFRVYDAEQRLLRALPGAIRKTNAADARAAFAAHRDTTRLHVDRLEHLFRVIDEMPHTDVDEGLRGILRNGERLLRERPEGIANDAALIAMVHQAVQHEMASYRTLHAWAQALRRPEFVQVFESALEDERQADEQLAGIAGALTGDEVTAAV